MSAGGEQEAVLCALIVAAGQGEAYPEQVAGRTPEFLTRRADGQHRQAMGERKVRKLLDELVAAGLAKRRRGFYSGHRFEATAKGKERVAKRMASRW